MLKKYLLIALTLIFYSQAIFSNPHYKNSSQNKFAQELFDKGMLNYYAYSYAQAEHDFRQALVYDSKCGICYWGIALAKKQKHLELGKPFAKVGFEDLKSASRLILAKDEFQFDLLQATRLSFSTDLKASDKLLQIQYINALKKLYQKYKDNKDWQIESLALLVDAMIYYNNIVRNNEGEAASHCSVFEAPNDYREEAFALLVPILSNEAYPDHPGLLHTYIHLAEHNLTDSLGLIAAKKLPGFSRGSLAAHYTHMSNHIYWRRGMYKEAIQANLDAIAIDEHYFKQKGAGLTSYYYEYHYLHYHHFLVALGVLTGNYELASKYAGIIKELMDVNRMDDLQDYRDIFLSLEHVVFARFNKWQEVLDLEIPGQSSELALLLINFSRSLAYLNLGQELQYKKSYEQIKKNKYSKQNMIDLQYLILSYLEASELNLHHASLRDLEAFFLKKEVNKIEEKLERMNPPLWFFSHYLFLSDVALARAEKVEAKKYHLLYEKIYPKSTLGNVPEVAW